MSKLKGMKKIHANFDAIYERLDTEFQRNLDNERIRGGIVAIFSKMCHDAVLRNKLFERGNYFSIPFPILG